MASTLRRSGAISSRLDLGHQLSEREDLLVNDEAANGQTQRGQTLQDGHRRDDAKEHIGGMQIDHGLLLEAYADQRPCVPAPAISLSERHPSFAAVPAFRPYRERSTVPA